MWIHNILGRCTIWYTFVRIMAGSAMLFILLAIVWMSYPNCVKTSSNLSKHKRYEDSSARWKMPRHSRVLQFMNVETSEDQDEIDVRLKVQDHTRQGTFLRLRNRDFRHEALKNYSSPRVGSSGAKNDVQYLNSEPKTRTENPEYINSASPKSADLPSRHTRRNSTERPVRRLPKVLIIGAKKAGTRALLEFLRIHPNVAGSGPEPHFFDRNYHRGLDWYRNLMPKTFHDQLTIEKTPAYFVESAVPRRVFDLDPNMKLLLMVRDPVTRAISDYCQAASKHPVRPFEQMAMLNESQGVVNSKWSAIRIGVYDRHLYHWLQVFPFEQIHIVDGQMLVDQPAAEVALVEKFLGIPSFIKDSHFRLRSFKGAFPCLVREDGSIHCLDRKSKGRKHPRVRPNVLRYLRDYYRPHNERFFRMVGRTFDWNG